MIRVAILAAAFAVAAQCTPAKPQPAPAPVPTVIVDAAPEPLPDADVDASKRSPCALACAHLAMLGCDAAKPTASGATCAQVCANNETGPGGTSLDTACVIKATTCPKAMACP